MTKEEILDTPITLRMLVGLVDDARREAVRQDIDGLDALAREIEEYIWWANAKECTFEKKCERIISSWPEWKKIALSQVFGIPVGGLDASKGGNDETIESSRS